MMKTLSHTDSRGRLKMVDVSDKPPQRRLARAVGRITVSPETQALISEGKIRKGNVFSAAQLAGIQAAKRTAELIPLCHVLTLDFVDVQIQRVSDGLEATSEVRCTGRTGAEMEALTAVAVALLTIYDMCKAVEKDMRIGEISLLEKEKRNVGTL